MSVLRMRAHVTAMLSALTQPSLSPAPATKAFQETALFALVYLSRAVLITYSYRGLCIYEGVMVLELAVPH